MDIFEDYIFVVLKMHSCDTEAKEIRSEQVSIVLGKNYVLTFQEKEGDVFNPVRNRTVRSPLNMPELNWYYGYPSVLVLMAVIGILMMYYFRRRHWL